MDTLEGFHFTCEADLLRTDSQNHGRFTRDVGNDAN